MNRIATACIVVVASWACAACSSRDTPPAKKLAPEIPTFVTVLVDYSASFAPLQQNDRLALKEVGKALSTLAVQTWSPPTTIVWRRIGSVSTVPPPLCDVMEYKRSIVGAAASQQQLEGQLAACTETVVTNSRAEKAPEPYTDISGAIMMAAQNWASLHAYKVLIIVSDMKEDLPSGASPTAVKLSGENVLLLHRPGTTETENITTYLDRIKQWQAHLHEAGAHNVRALPMFRATYYAIEEALAQEPDMGTSVSLIDDLATNASNDPIVMRAVTMISSAIAKAATMNSDAFPAPVAAGWFRTSSPAWRMVPVAPVVYRPRLVHRRGEINTVEDFTVALQELGAAVSKLRYEGPTDLDQSLALIAGTDTTSNRRLVLLSDFLRASPATATASLAGERVLLIYRTSRGASGADIFERLKNWQECFRRSGSAAVCALDISTLTTSAITSCLR